MEEKNKSKYEDEFDSLMKNKYIKIGSRVAVGLVALYLLSKTFSVVGNLATSFNNMRDSFKR